MYESPKPDRKMEDPYSVGIGPDMPYYHEFDPTGTGPEPRGAPGEGARRGGRARLGSTECGLSIHDN